VLWRSDLFLFAALVTQGTPVNIIVGSHVWLEGPSEAWVDGVVTEIKGRDATIATTNGKTVRSSFSPMQPGSSSQQQQSLKIHVPTPRALCDRDQRS
jgi:hypothetical protein